MSNIEQQKRLAEKSHDFFKAESKMRDAWGLIDNTGMLRQECYNKQFKELIALVENAQRRINENLNVGIIA
jgi:hypothetical protein